MNESSFRQGQSWQVRGAMQDLGTGPI